MAKALRLGQGPSKLIKGPAAKKKKFKGFGHPEVKAKAREAFRNKPTSTPASRANAASAVKLRQENAARKRNLGR